MCLETFHAMQQLDKRSVDLHLALQCAPMLTGLKISNLLILPTELEAEFREVGKKSKLAYFRVARTNQKTTFLLFDRRKLEQHLMTLKIQELLLDMGYMNLSMGGILRTFGERYRSYINNELEFPHEMGILLGYPLEDVIGFIENRGQNYLFSGYWKVYEKEDEKRALFEQYEKAQEKLILLLTQNISLKQIICGNKSVTIFT